MHQTVYNRTMATKTERLNLRLTPEQDAIVRSAAGALGESASDYVLRHAVAAAEIDLADRRVFVVDDEAFEALQRIASSTAPLPERLQRLLDTPSVLELSQ